MGRKWAVAVLAGVMLLTAACGGGDDDSSSDAATEAAATDAAEAGDGGGTGADAAAPADAGASGASTGTPACDLLDDTEVQSIFGGPVTKEPASGNSCNVSSDSGVFATYKFEIGSDIDNARDTIEESFDVETEDADFGERSFTFERGAVKGVFVLQGGRLANVAGNIDTAKLGELALAMF
jgi:hypothetical protein